MTCCAKWPICPHVEDPIAVLKEEIERLRSEIKHASTERESDESVEGDAVQHGTGAASETVPVDRVPGGGATGRHNSGGSSTPVAID